MPGTQQYKFAPPPPPPPGPPPSSQHPIQQYSYTQQPGQYQQHQQRGGGPSRGGRGGNFGVSSYNPQQPGSGYDPRHPQQVQAPGLPAGFNGPNGQQRSPPYTGSATRPPPQQGPGSAGYSSHHWQGNHHSLQLGPPQQHAQQPPMHLPPHPAPLSISNYHPNYAPQAYQQPQYGPQQHTPFQPQPPYVHSMPPNQPLHVAPLQIIPSQQWQGPPIHNRPHYNNHRGRGGFNNSGRGSHDTPAPLMGPPIRMGFDNDRGGSHLTQASHGFPPRVNNNTPTSFPQPQFPTASREFFQGGQRPPLDSVPYNASQRARGGAENSNFRNKTRGDSNQHQSRGRNDNRHNQNNGHKSTSENYHKPTGADANGKKKKKRRTNTLGLTPNGVDHEDSDDEVDDIDEEARLVTLLGPDTPQLPTDLDAWLAERKSRFPTKSVREAAAEKMRLAREQNRDGKKKKEHGDRAIKKEEGETKLEKQQRKAEKLRLELEKAERRIQQEISGSKRKRENGDEGDDDRGQVSDEDSESSSGSDSDEKPETFSSRSDASIRLPPAPKAQLQRHCKYFSTGGTCGKKGKCRFVHDQEVRNQALRDKEANGGKMTLAQRLILNDTAKDDLTILKSIKYLKEKGLMPEQLTGSAPTYEDETQTNFAEDEFAEKTSFSEN